MFSHLTTYIKVFILLILKFFVKVFDFLTLILCLLLHLCVVTIVFLNQGLD